MPSVRVPLARELNCVSDAAYGFQRVCRICRDSRDDGSSVKIMSRDGASGRRREHSTSRHDYSNNRKIQQIIVMIGQQPRALEKLEKSCVSVRLNERMKSITYLLVGISGVPGSCSINFSGHCTGV